MATNLDSIFPEQEPQEAQAIRQGRVRDLRPNELDRIYRGLDRSPEEIEKLRKEEQATGKPKKSWIERAGGFFGAPIAWGVREYNRNVALPVAEGMTLLAQSIFPGYAEREGSQRRELMKAWQDGTGFWNKLGAIKQTAFEQRSIRDNLFLGEKLIGEIAFDPFNFVGWGLLGKLPLLGRVLGPLERGYIKGSNKLMSAAIRTPLGVARGIPGFRGLFRLNTRSVANQKAAEVISSVRMSDITRFNDNAVGGLGTLRESIFVENLVETAFDAPILEARGRLMAHFNDLRDWSMGRKRFSFDKSGRQLSFVKQAGRDSMPAGWELFLSELNALPTQDAAKRMGDLMKRMVHDSKATQIIAERRAHKNWINTHVIDRFGVKIAPTFQRGKMATVNKALAELVLGFAAYGPFNVLEDVSRAFIGGERGIRLLEDDLALTLMGATNVSMPTTLMENLSTDLAAITGRGVGEGVIDTKLSGIGLLHKAWRILGGWSVDMSKKWSGLIRRGYVFERASKYQIEELGKVLGNASRQGLEAQAMRDYLARFGSSLTGFKKPVREAAQQLAWGLMGADSQAIRKAGAIAAKSHIKMSMIDEIISEKLPNFTPTSQRTLRDAMMTARGVIARFDEALVKVEANELEYMVVTEGEHAAKTVEWLLTSIDGMRVDNKQEMGQLIGMTANYAEQLITLPEVMTKAMIDQRVHKGPAALKTMWAKLDNSLNHIRKVLADPIVRQKVGAKFREMGQSDVAQHFDDILERANTTYDELSAQRNFWFRGGDDIAEEVLQQFPNKDAAWEAFGREKHLVVSRGAKDSYDSIIGAMATAEKIGLEDFSIPSKAYIKGRLDKVLSATMDSIKTKPVFQEKQNKLQALRTRYIEELQKGALSPQSETQLEAWFNGLADLSEKLPVYLRGQLQIARDKAWKRAIDDYHNNFVNYDDTMAVDDLAQAFMPFWRYESRAWPTIARFMVEKPFIGRSFSPNGYYFEATDEGYIPTEVLGFDIGLQVAPTRGTLLGRLRRFYKRGYPTTHTGMLGKIENIKQTLERMGFYAGTWQVGAYNTAMRGFGGGEGGGITAELGEDLPAALQTALATGTFLGIRAEQGLAQLERGKDATTYYREAIHTTRDFVNDFFPSRFREYYENIYLVTTYGKTRADVEGNPDDSWMLDEAMAQVAWRQVISEQSSLTRYRPKKFIEMRDRIDKKTSEISGLSLEELRKLRDKGQKAENVVALSRLERTQLTNLEDFRLVTSVYAPLSVSTMEQLQSLTREYYDDLDRAREQAKSEQAESDNDLNLGLITGGEWRKAYTDRWVGVNAVGDFLKKSPKYANALVDDEARKAFKEKFNISTPIRSPIDMVLDAYYEIEPLENPLTGQLDFNQFFRQRELTLNYLPPDIRRDVKEYLLSKDTPAMREFREGRQFMAVYWDTETYIPLWYNSMGMSGRATFYKQWAKEYETAQYAHALAIQRGVHPVVAERPLKRREFKLVAKWEQEYRALLRNPKTLGRVPWASHKIPDYLVKFFNE